MLIFSNPGELDLRLITTMGVNVKPQSDNPIGYFGTGLKYALAVIHRFGGRCEVKTGKDMLSFSVKEESIRGKEFDLLYMTRQVGEMTSTEIQLPFTLDLGKNWEKWMALRELWSNVQDEGGKIERVPDGEDWWNTSGDTVIAVWGLDDCWLARADWLLEGQAIEKNDWLEVYPGKSDYAFYRGIRVTKLSKPSAFTYNLLAEQRLTEDRTLDEWYVRYALGRRLQHMENKGVLRTVVLPKKDSFEEGLNFYEHDSGVFPPSKGFVDLVRENYRRAEFAMNKTALELVRSYHSEGLERQGVSLNAIEKRQLAKAKAFLLEVLDFDVQEEIVVVGGLGGDLVQGLAKDGKIWLPRSLFGKGTKYIAAILLEEHLHLAEGLVDESRGLQNRLFELVMSLGEKIQGEPL